MAKRSKREKEVDDELESQSKKQILAEFSATEALHVPARKPENILISIRLPMGMINQLREVAVRKNAGYQQIIKTFIADGLRRDYQPQAVNPSFFVVSHMGTCSNVDVVFAQEQTVVSGDYQKIA